MYSYLGTLIVPYNVQCLTPKRSPVPRYDKAKDCRPRKGPSAGFQYLAQCVYKVTEGVVGTLYMKVPLILYTVQREHLDKKKTCFKLSKVFRNNFLTKKIRHFLSYFKVKNYWRTVNPVNLFYVELCRYTPVGLYLIFIHTKNKCKSQTMILLCHMRKIVDFFLKTQTKPEWVGSWGSNNHDFLHYIHTHRYHPCCACTTAIHSHRYSTARFNAWLWCSHMVNSVGPSMRQTC